MFTISYTLSKHAISISTAHRGFIFNINVFISSRNVYRKIEVTRQVAPLESDAERSCEVRILFLMTSSIY